MADGPALPHAAPQLDFARQDPQARNVFQRLYWEAQPCSSDLSRFTLPLHLALAMHGGVLLHVCLAAPAPLPPPVQSSYLFCRHAYLIASWFPGAGKGASGLIQVLRSRWE